MKNENLYRNIDQVQYYTKAGLRNLLERYFIIVKVRYAVSAGKHGIRGLKEMRKTQPFAALKTIYGNMIHKGRSKGFAYRKEGTAHLVAFEYK